MKFLCLHGAGTSSQIFRMQTAALRYEVGDSHTYEFVQGVVPWALPAELASLSNPDAEHYAYYDTNSVPSFVTALDQLDAYIAAEGPFEGVLAFSQGAGLVATHLVRKHFLGAASPFRCAILIAPISVYDPAAYTERGEVRVLGEEAGPLIHIPTVVMWGERDERKEESRGLVKLCEPSLVEVFVHEGGHEVPGLGVKESIPGAVKVVRRGVSLAALSAA